jgi:hypothetical protein
MTWSTEVVSRHALIKPVSQAHETAKRKQDTEALGRVEKPVAIPDWAETPMTLQGRITYFLPARHFGFITCPDGLQFFFHDTNHVGAPALSQAVTFELAPPVKEGQRPMAVKVTPAVAVA